MSKINVGKSPAGIYLSNNAHLYIAVKGENIVTVVDTDSQKKIKDIKVGKTPYGVSQAKNTNFLFVTNVQSNSLL